MDRKKLFKRLAYLIFFVLAANFFANKFYWYFSVWYLDMIMHFLGGFWVGLASIYLFPPQNLSFRSVLTILFLVLLVGVGWEVFEFLVNGVIAQNPFDILDTASDIFFDLLGGLCAILYLLVPLKNQRTSNEE